MVYKEEEKIKKARSVSIAEGSAFSVMDGFGYSYVSPYANNFFKANTIQMGILGSLPGLFASLSELFSLKFMEKYSRKNIAIFATLLQALMWIPVIFLGFLFSKNPPTPLYFLGY